MENTVFSPITLVDFNNPAIYSRFCKICNDVAVENEIENFVPRLLRQIEEKSSAAYMNHDGFVVLKPVFYNDELTMLIQMAYCVSGDGYKKYINFIEGIAEYVQCKAIMFYGFRLGFIRLAKKLGYSRIPYDGPQMGWRKAI